MNTTPYEALSQRGSDWASLVRNLEHIEAAVASIPFEPFFEPVAVLHGMGSPSVLRLMLVTASHLNAWTRHIAYGTIAKLGSLTGPCLNFLAKDQLDTSGLLQRCILEHAGRAAHSLDSLQRCHKKHSWDDMAELIPKSLFGTCSTRLEGTVFAELAELTAQRPVKPSELIKSLESFAGTFETTGRSFFDGLYSLLCDLAHPSQRANSGFCRMLKDTGSGWFLRYEKIEERNAEASLGGLRATMRCLQAGYAASALLLRWDFDDDVPDHVVSGPEEDDIAWVLQNILDPGFVFGQ
jgi:hypothetical protein